MNKKLAIIAVICTASIILGGINTTLLYGTTFLESKPGYTFAVSDAADWWNCSWSYCKKIIIDHTKVQSDQTDFPVLLYRSSDSDLANYAQSDGDDITFVNAYNTSQYEHEIEEYDSATGELTVWVEISSISNTVDTVLYMYYGNPDCSSQQNITGTWDSNYIMVQHLEESLGTIYDSTSNDNDGTNSGASANSSSKIDGGYNFGGNDYIDCGTNSSLNITNQITLEGWVKDPPLFEMEQQKNNVYIIDKRDEKLPVIPGESFTVKRTIATDIPDDVIFVALFSPGVKIEDMSIQGISVFADYCNSGRMKSDEEIVIENIRNKLPEKLRELEMVAYSKPFTVGDDKVEIEMTFETEKTNSLLYNGRISYLVFSDDSFDFEATTHLNYPLGLTDWLNPFSIFEGIIDFFTGGDDNKVIIADKHDENVQALPGTQFYVERTFESPAGSKLTIVPLFSDSLELEKIEVVDSENNAITLDSKVSNARNVGTDKELEIDNFRKKLPSHIQKLEEFAYSEIFESQGTTTVRFWFEAPTWEEITSGEKSSTGRISYLVFSTDDYYDFEGSTWWNATWGCRKLITVNSSQISANLNNFPILVNITDADLASKAQNDGDDIAFLLFSDNSTQLNHEIELFNGTSGELFAWVNVTSLSSSVDTKIWMYYNNSGASNQQNPTDVWDSNYLAVWHLNETSGTVYDSTSNDEDSTAVVGVTQDADGFVDGGDSFDGSSDYIDFNTNLPSTVTISAWATFTGASDMLWVIDSDNNGPDLWFTGGNTYLNTWDGSGNPFCAQPSGVNEWHLYTAVIESGNTVLYINDGLEGTANYRNPTGSDFPVSYTHLRAHET